MPDPDDDAGASQQVKMRLLAADAAAFQEVDVEVANGSLLLSGSAPTDEHRLYATFDEYLLSVSVDEHRLSVSLE